MATVKATPQKRNKALSDYIANHYVDKNGNNNHNITRITWNENESQWTIVTDKETN